LPQNVNSQNLVFLTGQLATASDLLTMASNKMSLARQESLLANASYEFYQSRGEDCCSRGRAMNISSGRTQIFTKNHLISWF